ncbi:MAG: hypothetical protein DRQ45_07860 [Gammaproteobacteria bacterium]|nr:MAG: hypothetical protein DRQ45_07860 [Gammaproteobacteria bacterium]
MKFVTRLIMLALFLLPLHTMAADEDDTRELAREAIQANKKLVVAANMNLNVNEKEGFWAVYEDYQKDLEKILERTVALIEEFAVNFETLSEKKATELLNTHLKIEADTVKLKKSYVSKFQKVLPAQKVVRYYQIENKIEAIIDYDLVDKIPLAIKK